MREMRHRSSAMIKILNSKRLEMRARTALEVCVRRYAAASVRLISRTPAAFLKNLAELNFSRRPMRTALSSRVWRLGRRRSAAQRASIKKASPEALHELRVQTRKGL